MSGILDSTMSAGRRIFLDLVGIGKDAKIILGAIFDFRVHIVILKGQMRGDDEEVALLYVGRQTNLPHFVKKYFVAAETVYTKKSNLLIYQKHMKAAENKADIVFIDIGRPYDSRINKHGEYLDLPPWISMVVLFEKDWDSTVLNFRKTMRKNIGRLIRRNNYRCEPTNDPVIIEKFYDDYYVPFVSSRHADEAFLTSRAQIEKCARDGTILQVIGDNGLVAAGVYFPKGKMFVFLDAGMPEAYIDHPPEAAIWALYYFALRYAFDGGYEGMNLMGARAFPTDGVFQFKRKWGAKVKDIFCIDSIYFKPLNNSSKAVRFCELFPFIARKNGSLELVLSATSKEFGDTECSRMLTDHFCEGMAQIRVVHLSKQEPSPVISEKYPNVRVISSNLADFSDNFTRH